MVRTWQKTECVCALHGGREQCFTAVFFHTVSMATLFSSFWTEASICLKNMWQCLRPLLKCKDCCFLQDMRNFWGAVKQYSRLVFHFCILAPVQPTPFHCLQTSQSLQFWKGLPPYTARTHTLGFLVVKLPDQLVHAVHMYTGENVSHFQYPCRGLLHLSSIYTWSQGWHNILNYRKWCMEEETGK